MPVLIIAATLPSEPRSCAPMACAPAPFPEVIDFTHSHAGRTCPNNLAEVTECLLCGAVLARVISPRWAALGYAIPLTAWVNL